MSSDQATPQAGRTGHNYGQDPSLLGEPLYNLMFCSEYPSEGNRTIYTKRRQFMNQMTPEIMDDLCRWLGGPPKDSPPLAEYFILGYLDYTNGLLSSVEIGDISRYFPEESRDLYICGVMRGVLADVERKFSAGDFHRHPNEGKLLEEYDGIKTTFMTVVVAIHGPDSNVTRRVNEIIVKAKIGCCIPADEAGLD